VCPLDVIKTRFQVHGRAQLTNGDVKGISFYFGFLRNHFFVVAVVDEFHYHQLGFFFGWFR
jgi:hypothetical protein